MLNVTDLERRKSDILEAIIEAYISAASPVGSELISRKLRQSLSSATIRHVMAELEEDGFLEQPHTSAGRVPTDRGYRAYVNNLRKTGRLTSEESERLARFTQLEAPELQQLFEQVGQVLAELSHQASVVLAPTVRQSTIKQIELLPVGVRKLLCVMVGQEAIIASHVVEIAEPISRDEALSLAHFLNTELSGLPIQELLDSLGRRMLAVNDSFYYLVKRSLAILELALATEPQGRCLVEGAIYLFEQPEFRNDPVKAHELLRHLEVREALSRRMREDLTTEATAIRIGQEVAIDGLSDCSYVLAPFGPHEAALGGIGVLGPKRMDYRRMLALVEGMASLITEVLSQSELEAD